MATKEMIPTVLIPTVLIPTVLMAMICQKKVILTFTIVALIQMNGKYVFFSLVANQGKLTRRLLHLLRLIELAKYCGDDLEDLSGCECPPARELLADGTLVCATGNELGVSPPACPEDCPVCEFCMVLEGCEDIYGPKY